MKDASIAKANPRCRGRRPWLGGEGAEDCAEQQHLLVRTASNSYFTQVESAVSIPDPSEAVRSKVEAVWDVLESATAEDLPVLRKVKKVKPALEGLSDVYAAELARNNIQVTTINPGLMRTGSFYHANFKGRYQQEFAWFSALATNPLVAMSSARAAKQVIQALRYAVPEKTLTFQARILQLVEEISPNLTAWILKTTNQALPRPAGLPKQELKTGFESRTEKVPRSLTKLGDRAAQKNNELIAKY